MVLTVPCLLGSWFVFSREGQRVWAVHLPRIAHIFYPALSEVAVEINPELDHHRLYVLNLLVQRLKHHERVRRGARTRSQHHTAHQRCRCIL